uniref:Uncharacterized protein n=1 Tax=Macrostomum lignano TaxID=282301 RepID=A0A1I8IFS1_9PLAT
MKLRTGAAARTTSSCMRPRLIRSFPAPNIRDTIPTTSSAAGSCRPATAATLPIRFPTWTIVWSSRCWTMTCRTVRLAPRISGN